MKLLKNYLRAFGYLIAPFLFLGANDEETIAERLRFAYKLVGVKVIKVISQNSTEIMIFLCPYRNLSITGKPKEICHQILDKVDEGYADFLRRKNIRYSGPKSYGKTDYCFSKVSKL